MVCVVRQDCVRSIRRGTLGLIGRTLLQTSNCCSRTHRRSVWTAYSAPHPSNLTSCLQDKAEPDLCVVLASRTLKAQDLEGIPGLLSTLLRPKSLIGCVVDRVYAPASRGHGVSVLLGKFEKPVTITSFVERAATRRQRFKSVGRWFTPDELRTNEDLPTWSEFGRSQSASISTSNKLQLPHTLRELRRSQTSPELLLMLSDQDPHQFLVSIDHHFPTTKKLGIVGASTPFVTGHPVLLFHDSEVHSEGIVGLAVSSEGKQLFGSTDVEYPSLRTISDPVKITRCRGNIVLELGGLSAAQQFLSRVQADKSNLFTKETEFYMGLCPEDTISHAKPNAIYRITSGDLAKGNMALDMVDDLVRGQNIVFMCRTNDDNDSRSFPDSQTVKGGICITMVTADSTNDVFPEHHVGTCTQQRRFGGISENGIIVGQGRYKNSWLCNVPDSTVQMLTAPNTL